MENLSPPKAFELDKFLHQPLSNLHLVPQDKLLKLVAEILQISLDQRDDRHKKILHAALQEVSFFKKMIAEKGEILFEKCINRLRYCSMRSDQVVCSIGERGSTFYILLGGDVSVNVQVQKINEEIAKSSNGRKITTYLELEEVTILKAGSHFGELALLNDAPRTATIICKGDCEFAVLSREDFKAILARHHLWQVQQDIKFFSTTPLFATSSARAISTLIYHFKLLNLQRNSLIFKEGDEATHLYIIKKGEVTITKTVMMKPEFDAFSKEDSIRPPKSSKRVLEIAILGEKESLGEEELYYGTPREFTAKISSLEAEIYALEKKDFQKRLKETKEFIVYLNSYCKEKLETRNQRIASAMEMAENNRGIWGNAHKPSSSWPRRHVRRKYQKEIGEKKNLADSPNKKSSLEAKPISLNQSLVSSLLNPVDLSFVQSQLAKFGSQSVHQSPSNKHENPQSPLGAKIKLLKGVNNTSFFETQQFSPKKNVKIATQSNNNNKTLMSSELEPPRHRSLPHARKSNARNTLKELDSISHTSTLFEKKIFERNHPSLGTPRIKIHTHRANEQGLSSLNASPRIEQSQQNSPNHLHSARATRSYFTSRNSEPKRIFEYQDCLIKAQEMLLTTKFHHQLDKEHLLIDLSEDLGLQERRQGKTFVMPISNLSVLDRLKNLPYFQANLPKKTEELPGVKNIHVHAKKLQSFSKDAFKTQIRIFNHIREEELTHLQKSPANKSKMLNKTGVVLAAESSTRDQASSPIPLNHSELNPNSAISSLVGLHINEQSNWLGVDKNNKDLAPSPGLTVRSFKAKSIQDL